MDNAFIDATEHFITGTLRGDESPFRESLERFGKKTLEEIQKENYHKAFRRK